MDISRPESEPQKPQGQGESRRLTLGARRNKSWAKVIMVLLLAVIGPAVAAIILANLQTGPGEGDSESAKEKEKAAEERLALAESAKRRFQRESLLERLERLRLTPHSTSWNASKCWSDQAWELVSQVAALGIDDDLRNQAAATLLGIDARLVKPFREMAASSVVFDAQGKRLLIGGTPAYQQYPAEEAKVWDSETKVVLHVSNLKEAGPVAFGPDSVPLQLVVREGPSLLLWNVVKQEAVAKFAFDPEQGRVVQLALNAHRFPLLAMTADGSLVAAAAISADQNGVIVVWEGLSGKRLFQMPAQATALAAGIYPSRPATDPVPGLFPRFTSSGGR
jgi:hypothetical protein